MSDIQTALLGTGTGGTILTVLYFLYKACNGKRCKCKFFGYDIENSIDIGEITPPERGPSRFENRNPLSVIVPNPVG
jgi:hypothetical protein